MLLESALALSVDHDVVIALPESGPLAKLCGEQGFDIHIQAFPVLRKRLATPRGAFTFLLQLLRALPGQLQIIRSARAEVVYVNTVTIPEWLLAARLARISCLCHVHEAEKGTPRLVRRLLALPLVAAHRMVVNSDATRDLLISSMRSLSDRIDVIHNGVAPPPGPVSGPREILSEPVRLLLVGRLSPRKGTDVAIEAVQLLIDRGLDVQLLLAGSTYAGYEWFEEELRARASRRGLSERVTFSGFIPQVWSAHAKSDIVLMPSRIEPFGNAAVEAMLSMRPVIASDVQGLREILDQHVTGLLVPPGDAHALADAVEQLVGNWAEARRMAERARRSALDRFAPSAYATKIRAAVSHACQH